MDLIFNICVTVLYDLADWTGLTYKEINVWIFCIVWPIVTVWLCVSNIVLRKKLKSKK